MPTDPFRTLRTRNLAWRMALAYAVAGAAYGAALLIKRPRGPGWEVASDFLYDGVLLALLYVWSRRHHADWRAVLGRPPKDRRAWWLLLFILPLMGVSLSSGVVISHFLPVSSDEPATNKWEDFYQLIEAITAAPLTEEIVFRGILFRRWAEKWGLWRGLLGSAVLFGLMHASDRPGAVLFAIVSSLIYLKTRSLFLPVVFHSAFNFLASFPALILENTDDNVAGEAPELVSTSDAWIAGAVLFASVMALLWMIRRLRPFGNAGSLWEDREVSAHEVAPPPGGAA